MPDSTPSPDSTIDLADPVTDADHAQGPPDAPVTLVEYGDFECPDCLNALPIVNGLRRHLGDRLRIVFRHFPQSSVHPGASAAAAAAEAAAVQGKFWEMHDALFLHQRELINIDFAHLALGLGVELYKFELDRESKLSGQHVRNDIDSGTRSGVRGTPTFFINGTRYQGKIDLPSMTAAIEGRMRS
jgi:protein-disulfide isomerase